jgi:hypothetical protein
MIRTRFDAWLGITRPCRTRPAAARRPNGHRAHVRQEPCRRAPVVGQIVTTRLLGERDRLGSTKPARPRSTDAPVGINRGFRRARTGHRRPTSHPANIWPATTGCDRWPRRSESPGTWLRCAPARRIRPMRPRSWHDRPGSPTLRQGCDRIADRYHRGGAVSPTRAILAPQISRAQLHTRVLRDPSARPVGSSGRRPRPRRSR